MKKILINSCILFLIFQNILFNIIDFPNFFNYWDELVEIFFIMLGVMSLFYKKNTLSRRSFKIVASLLIVMIIGLFGNLFFEYMDSINAIIRDMIVFLKFPITLLIINELNIDNIFNNIYDEKFVKIIKYVIVIIFSLGIFSIFKDIGLSQNEIRYGIKPYQFLFSHPTFLVLSSIFLLAIIESIDFKNSNLIYIYEFMLLVIIVLTLRTKGIAVVGLFIFIKYIFPKIKNIKSILNFKKLNYKNISIIFGGIIVSIVTIYFIFDKISLYLSFPSSPREELYRGCFLLAMMCFPFGSGFGTFASHISGKFNSKVYDFIKISYYWTENGIEMSVLGDAGLTYYIGQFGFIGTLLLIYVFFKLFSLTIDKCQNKLPVILIWVYVIVTLTSESILVNNGLELAIMLSYISFINKKTRVKLK